MAANSAAAPTLAPELETSTRQAGIITAWVVLMTLAAIAVGLRFYTRRLIIRVLGLEDWLVLIAMILAVATCIGFIRQTFISFGHHIWTLNPEMMTEWGMEQWYSFLFYTLSLAFTKVSILGLYMRILVYGRLQIANYILMGIVMSCNLWVFIGNFISCIPLEKNWKPDVPGEGVGFAISLGNSILHIITDFMIFSLPLPVLFNLRISRRQKISLVSIFSLGLFVCLISIIRMVSIGKLSFNDISWEFSVLAYWGAIEVNLATVEVNMAIICACLTPLKPLLDRLFPQLLGSAHFPSSLPASIVNRSVGAVAIQQRRQVTVAIIEAPERYSVRLNDDSTKPTEAFPPLDILRVEEGSAETRAVAD